MNDLWKLKKKDFIATLNFLTKYGFSYHEDSSSYVNKYGQAIKFSVYRLDPNLWVPSIKLINNSSPDKEKILQVNNEFKLISKKIFKSEKFKLAYIVKHQIEMTNSIYGLLIDKNPK